jgi:malate synthase
VRHGRFGRAEVERAIDEEIAELRAELGDEAYEQSRADEAREIFEQAALGEELVEFLTLPAYDYLERGLDGE